MRQPSRLPVVFLLFTLLTLCACQATRPSGLSTEQPWMVVVKSAPLPSAMPWYTHFAEHTWVDMKCGSESSWRRVEVMGTLGGVCVASLRANHARKDWRWGDRPVRVLRTIEGDEAMRIAAQVQVLPPESRRRYALGGYQAWPGPNSNTFARDLNVAIPELAFVFDHNAVGKDYGWWNAGLTPSGTGVQLDTMPAGLALGLEEGLELHVLQLTFALRFWPPRLALPMLPAIPWDEDPETPVAVTSCPRDVDLDLALLGTEEHASGNLEGVLQRTDGYHTFAMEGDERCLFRLHDRSGWILATFDNMSEHSCDAVVLVQGDDRTEQRIHVRFDDSGKAIVGDFQIEDLEVGLQLERDPQQAKIALKFRACIRNSVGEVPAGVETTAPSAPDR